MCSHVVVFRWDDCNLVSSECIVKYRSVSTYAALNFGACAGTNVTPQAYGIQMSRCSAEHESRSNRKGAVALSCASIDSRSPGVDPAFLGLGVYI